MGENEWGGDMEERQKGGHVGLHHRTTAPQDLGIRSQEEGRHLIEPPNAPGSSKLNLQIREL